MSFASFVPVNSRSNNFNSVIGKSYRLSVIFPLLFLYEFSITNSEKQVIRTKIAAVEIAIHLITFRIEMTVKLVYVVKFCKWNSVQLELI